MPVLDPLVEVETPTRIVRVPTIHDSAARQVSGTAVFIDDILEYVEAARSLGLHGFQYLNPGQLRSDLRSLDPSLAI